MAGLTTATRRRALWTLGAAGFLIGIVLLALDGRMYDAGGPGIVGFELAGSVDRSREVLVEWGWDGRDAARLSLWLDYAYLVVYGAFWALAAAAIRDLARRQGWSRFAAVGSAMVVLAPAAALLDAIENVGLLLALGRQGGELAPRLGAVAAVGKFVLIDAVIAYVAVGLVRGANLRFPRGTRAVAAGGASVLVALLAVNTWAVNRETKPARADSGRIIELPGGDLHVREDGDRRNPPLVLVHGFASSMRWWERVVPALARERRVIRIDLLGHGGSEAPRDGYSMENQADLVAATLGRLGVGRTAVVGHSMGGFVATALVERHRGLVSRLMVIGTPSHRRASPTRVTDYIVFAPVIGQAVRRLAPDSLVRAQLEAALLPEVDVPHRLVEDVGRATYSSLRESGLEGLDYREDKPLDERLADERLPLTAVFGTRDNVVRPRAAADYRDVPGARIVRLEGLGHTPQIERPARVARLILAFAR